MGSLEDTCVSLRAQITATETQLAALKRDLEKAERAATQPADAAANSTDAPNGTKARWPLLQEEYKRYGRQLIMPQVGLQGKRRVQAEGPGKKICG